MTELILTIQHGDDVIQVAVKDDITLTRTFGGKPSKLSFSAFNDNLFQCFEGDRVKLLIDDTVAFHGYIFTKNNTFDDFVHITCYDQLRYLKNKDTYIIKEKTAADVIKMFCEDFHLKYGDVADTGYVVPARINDNKTLIDIIYWYLYTTHTYTKKLYELYDDDGKICLTNIEDMKLDYLLDGDVYEDMNYKSSIDEDTYNAVKLIESKKKKGESRKVYYEKDDKNIGEWGKLQYFDTVDEKTDGAKKAKEILALKNRKTRDLTIKNAIGDIRIRGGSSIFCKLNIGEMILNNYMLVDKVIHKFAQNEHFMDLTLKGRDIGV